MTPQPPAAAGPPPAPAPPVRAGVGVGVGVLVLHEGLVLLGRRLGTHGAGTWAAPGGRLEFGEGIEACAARELLEETGLSARVLELGPYTNDIFVPEQQHFVTIFVVARSIVGTPRNLEPARCEGWAWFPWDDWPSPLFPPLHSLRQIGWRPGGA